MRAARLDKAKGRNTSDPKRAGSSHENIILEPGLVHSLNDAQVDGLLVDVGSLRGQDTV